MEDAFHRFCQLVFADGSVDRIETVEGAEIGGIGNKGGIGVDLQNAGDAVGLHMRRHIPKFLTSDVFDKQIGHQKLGARERGKISRQIHANRLQNPLQCRVALSAGVQICGIDIHAVHGTEAFGINELQSVSAGDARNHHRLRGAGLPLLRHHLIQRLKLIHLLQRHVAFVIVQGDGRPRVAHAAQSPSTSSASSATQAARLEA